MIKTIADAYEVLKGDLSNTYLASTYDDDKYLFYRTGKGDYILDDVKDDEGGLYQYICTVEEFNNFKPESKVIKFDLETLIILRNQKMDTRLIKFNLQAALDGDKVVTRDGREVTNLVRFPKDSGACVYGLDVANDTVESWFDNGSYHNMNTECGGDLFMAPKQLSGFVNVYADRYQPSPIHATKEIADEYSNKSTRLACIDLSQFPEGHGL